MQKNHRGRLAASASPRSPPLSKVTTIDIRQFFPFLNWPRPTASSLRQDAWAGITVGLVLVPQAVAYATLAGMPPQTGLYAALLPSIIGALWGSSALLAVGPVALTSLLTFGSLAPMAIPGSAHWVTLAIWLALYSGCFQFLLGAFRFGRIADIVSQPVIIGFINAASLIIITSQLPALLGVTFSLENFIHPGAIFAGEGMLLTAAFGLTSLVLLGLFKRFMPRFPAMLAVTLVGIQASWAIDYAARGGNIVGTITAGMPLLVLPSDIPFSSHQELWPAALIIALISFTEAMSSCRVLARKRKEAWHEDQELIGQGLAKIVSGLCGAFPVSGSFSRSALNLYAGATSAWSTLFSAGCVVVCLLFFVDLLYFLPRSVLAAMIIVPVIGLLDWRAFRRLLRVSRGEGLIALATFAVTLLSTPRLHWGVFVGVGLTMLSFLYRRAHPRLIEVGEHPDGTLRDRRRFDIPRLAPDVLAVRLDSALNFLTAAMLERFVNEQIREDPQIVRVLVCAGSINDIDISGIDILEAISRGLHADGRTLYVSAMKKQVWDVLGRAGVIADIGSEHIFSTDADAIRAMNLTPHQSM